MQVRIKGYTFTLSEPFRSGTVITKGEAQALNGLRAENIQNNTRRLLDIATANLLDGELLPQAVLDEIQSKITAYDANYQFLEKHTPKPRLGDIEAEAAAIAQERLEASLRQSGREPLDPVQTQQVLDEMARLPAVLEEARERVAAKRRALAEGLDDL